MRLSLQSFTAPSALLIGLLIISSPMMASHSATTTPLPYQLSSLSGYYQPYQIDAPSTPTTISIAMSSNTTLSTAIMTTTQYNNFNNGASDISAVAVPSEQQRGHALP